MAEAQASYVLHWSVGQCRGREKEQRDIENQNNLEVLTVQSHSRKKTLATARIAQPNHHETTRDVTISQGKNLR